MEVEVSAEMPQSLHVVLVTVGEEELLPSLVTSLLITACSSSLHLWPQSGLTEPVTANTRQRREKPRETAHLGSLDLREYIEKRCDVRF